ncbi:unnamed protein product [Laminaria digitata]
MRLPCSGLQCASVWSLEGEMECVTAPGRSDFHWYLYHSFRKCNDTPYRTAPYRSTPHHTTPFLPDSNKNAATSPHSHPTAPPPHRTLNPDPLLPPCTLLPFL